MAGEAVEMVARAVAGAVAGAGGAGAVAGAAVVAGEGVPHKLLLLCQ